MAIKTAPRVRSDAVPLRTCRSSGRPVAIAGLGVYAPEKVDAALAKYRADKHITDTWEARERVVVAVIEFVEQLDELVAAPGLHLEIIDMEVVPLGRQRYQSHRDLLLHFTSSSRRRPGPTFPRPLT